MNRSLWKTITIYAALHGSRQGRGAVTDTMEENLAQQIAGIVHEMLFQMFINVRKSCDYLDKRRYMEILRGYGSVNTPRRHWNVQ